MTNQTEANDAEAVEILQKAVKEFSTFVRQVPDKALVEKAWGPKEVLAHLVFWLESYVIQSEVLLAGDKPVLPQGHFDDLNTQAVKASRSLQVTALLQRHQIACDHLREISATNDANELVLTLKKGSSFQHPLTKYLIAEAGHIKWHQNILAAQRDQVYLADIEQLHASVSAFSQFIQQLPQKDLLEQRWGPKEVLAHLVFWHERALAQVEALVAGKPLVWDEKQRIKDLNAQAVAASSDVPVAELLRHFERTNQQLCHYGRTLDPQNFVVKVQAHVHTLDGAIVSLASHVRNHHQQLVKEMAG